MPWFPDFVGAVELAGKQTRAAGRADVRAPAEHEGAGRSDHHRRGRPLRRHREER